MRRCMMLARNGPQNPGMALRVALLCLLLLGCSPQVTRSVPERPSTLAWPEGGRLQALVPARSRLHVLVGRAGPLAALGHSHVLAAPGLQGWLWTAGAGLDGARFVLRLRLDELELDRPELRAELGPDFASRLDAEAIAGTRAHMLGPEGLDAVRHPWLELRSVLLEGAPPHLRAQIEIALHGERRRQWVDIDVSREAAGWRGRGVFSVKQSDFGIRPYSVLGGMLAVDDVLNIRFDLAFSPAQ